MGELDEKESPPSSEPQHETEEPKETDKMLEKKDETTPQTASSDSKIASSPKSQQRSTTTVKDEAEKKKVSTPTTGGGGGGESDKKKEANGEEIINIPESGDNATSKAAVTQEGREVKPKKIPIGGIKMPGFFTRGKSPRGEGDGAEGGLLEKEGNENKLNEEKPKDDDEKRPGIGKRIRNFFLRKRPAKLDEDTKDTKSGETQAADDQEPPPKKGLLNAIKLPIATMIPKRKADNSDDVELGTGPGTKAGLASMETLDDSLKDQDTVDRAAKTNNDDTLETVKLTDEKKDEKQQEEQNLRFIDRIRTYRCSVDDLAIVAGIIIFILLVGIICVFSFSGGDVIKSAPIRDGRFVVAVTSCGPVEGVKEDGAFAFYGIPYAVPPIGENRWKPAQLIENIDECWNETLKAHNTTEYCSQTLSNGTIIGDEDCLTLDVITPHIRYDNPLPVVVLIGAESLLGGSPTVLKPSSQLANEKDVLFVRLNFRMGALGFLALDELSKSVYPPTSGNYALSDILAALRWIQRNIAHFGGDPKSVVLFGHRAGATLVSALVTSPQIKGLYKRAWSSSSASIFPGRPLAESERANHEYMTYIQCNDADCLRAASVEHILNAVPDTWRYSAPDLPSRDGNSTARHEWLVLDGNILQKHPADVWSKEFAEPTLVLGTTAHESHSEKLHMKNVEWDTETVRKHVENSKLGELGFSSEAAKRYNATYQGLAAMISDIRTVCPLLTVARSQPSAPFYVVNQVDPQKGIADVDADVRAIMGQYEASSEVQKQFVSSLQKLFFHWVSHGEMKLYEPRRRVLIIGQEAVPSEDYPNCDFWISQDVVPRYGRID